MNLTPREKCPYSEFLWSVFSRIRTEYGEMRMRGNASARKYRHFSRSVTLTRISCYHFQPEWIISQANFNLRISGRRVGVHSPVRSLCHTLHAGLQPLWNEGKQTALSFTLWFSLSNTYNSENTRSSCIENYSNNAKSQPNLNFCILPSGKQWHRRWLEAIGRTQQRLKFLHS